MDRENTTTTSNNHNMHKASPMVHCTSPSLTYPKVFNMKQLSHSYVYKSCLYKVFQIHVYIMYYDLHTSTQLCLWRKKYNRALENITCSPYVSTDCLQHIT